MTEAAHCSHPGEHRTLDEQEFIFLALSSLMERAKAAIGESDRPDALWMST